jgi:small subunit ribosomal protein S17
MNDMPDATPNTGDTATPETDDTATEATPPSAAAKPAPSAATSTTAVETTEPSARAPRKVREGVVVSSGMDKTVVVAVIERVRHPRYNKFVNRTKKLYVHDEINDANAGDRVRVMETRPLSKTKRWRIMEVLERAK